MLELFITGIGVVVGYLIGEMVTVWRVRYIFQELKKKGVRLEEHIVKPTTVYQLEVEQVNDMLYLYERQKNEFVCQAKTIEELATLALKYKNITYAAVLYGESIYSFIDGKIQKQYES